MKERSLSKCFSLAKFFPFFLSFSHSSANSSISLSFHSDVPRACSCPWETDVLLGIMATCHIFLSIYILLWIVLCPNSQFGTLYMEHICCVCLCVESWSQCLSVNSVTTAPNSSWLWYLLPPAPHICSCVFASAACCSQTPHSALFYPWGGTQNEGEKVARFPPLGFPDPTGTQTHSNVLWAHARCLVLSDLHMSLSNSIMHRDAVELSLRWGSAYAVFVLKVYWFLDLSAASRLL